MSKADALGCCDDDIAIVGIGVRFPGAANLDEFRVNLATGRDSVGPMPESRAEATGLDRGTKYLPMGHLDDIQLFDYEFFGLSRREASVIDPQQRIAVQLAYRAIEDAGYAVSTLVENSTAVVFSASLPTYHGVAADPGPLSMLGNLPFGTPARIAHLLGLTGPCYAVDSGCNGSIVAVHHACREIACGTAEYAVAGGVSVRANGFPQEGIGAFTEIISPNGRCRAFDADADGTAAGEGGAAMLLTTVRRAQADRAPIHAVIRASAVLHNGHSSATISSPSAAGHERVIAAAWRVAGVPPAAAGYLEAHGSGTRLGDAVELEGIVAAFRDRLSPLPIGSVKTNIGHLDHAAGIAGLVKAVLSVSHGELYPSLHFDRPTGCDDLGTRGIEIVTATRQWPGDAPRLAGVSSYSLGGINAHCVVAQPPAVHQVSSTETGRARLVGVSARSQSALVGLCCELADAVVDGALDLDDVALTLNRGRDHFEHRFATVVRSPADLANALRAGARGAGSEPIDRQVPAVALLLSPDTPPVGVSSTTLPDRLPARGHTAEVLAGQLAVHDRLRACGVELAGVLSAGSSRFLARYLLGSRTEIDPTELAAAEPVIDVRRLVQATDKLLSNGPVIFLEPSPGGRLGELLRTELQGRSGAEVIVAAADSGELLDLLGVLYERGVDLDWTAVGPSAHRVRLPGHPMRGARCWVSLPSVSPRIESAMPAIPTQPAADASAGPAEWLRATLRELLHAESEIVDGDDYFELGGNSIIAIQLVERVNDTYGFRPKLMDVYQRPKVADFAELLDAADRLAINSELSAPPELVAHDAPVMSLGQERMWFHHQFDPVTTLYNYPFVMLVRGRIDVDAIRGVFVDLADRHEPFRYNFAEADGRPVLRVRSDLGDFFRYVDVSDESEPTIAARELVRAAAETCFDLATDSLLRVLMIRLAPDRHVMQITCHHAVTDGATAAILSQELPELYGARCAERPHRLAPLPFRFRDYAWWQRRLLANKALDHELRHWTDTLRDAPTLRLPTDFPRPERKTFTGDLYPFMIPGPLGAELRKLARRESVSLFVVLLAGLYLMLGRYSGQRDIVVGTPTSGRNRREFHGMIGYFNSTVALRADLSGDTSLSAFLGQVRSVVLGALENQEIPFDRVVNALGGPRDLSRTPIFDVVYVHQEVPRFVPFGAATCEPFDVVAVPGNIFGGLPAGTAKFDFTLITFDRGDQDSAACVEFSTELFTAGTVARMVAAYLEILGAMAASKDTLIPVHSLVSGGPPLDPAPRLLVPTDRPRTGHQQFLIDVVVKPITAELVARLTAVVGAPDAMDTAMLAAWLTLLAWYSGQDDLALGVAHRHPERPREVRIDVTDEPTFVELAERIRAVVGQARPGSAGQAEPAVHYCGERLPERGRCPVTATAVELALSWARSESDTVTLELDYATDLFEQDTALGMLADLRRTLETLVSLPSRSIHDAVSEAVARSAEWSS